MLDKTKAENLPTLKEHDTTIGDETVKITEMFIWEDFEVYVTRLCDITVDDEATDDCPANIECNEGEIVEINLRTYDIDADRNLLFSRQEPDLPTVIHELFPFSPLNNQYEVYINQENWS